MVIVTLVFGAAGVGVAGLGSPGSGEPILGRILRWKITAENKKGVQIQLIAHTQRKKTK